MALTIDLTGRVVLVTGGSRGIGRGITEAFVSAGATVVTCARSEAEPFSGTTHVQCDVRDPESVQAMVDRIVAKHGRLDVLINNAGGAPSASAAEASPRFHDKIIALNLNAPLLVAQIANRAMQEQGSGGSIVNISSIAANRPAPTIAAYAAAKAGVSNFTQWLAVHMAQEYSPNIRVNAIAPGFFLTEQNRFLMTDAATGDLTPRGRKILDHTPMGRFGAPRDLLGTVLWLMSPASAFVTGIVVPVDGGFSAYSGV